MASLQDLHTLVRLLSEFNLPVSPILEYEIKERERQFGIVISKPVTMDDAIVEDKDAEYYRIKLSGMSVGKSKGKNLPHKAILMLALIRLIERNVIMQNQILLDSQISNAFAECWNHYFTDLKCPSVWIPFWYMKSESFWHFQDNGNRDLLNGLLEFAGHPSVGQMRPVIKYAFIDDELFALLQDFDIRKQYVAALETTYILGYKKNS